MGQHPILTVENLKVIVSTPYGVTQAVNDVSFKLQAGKVLGIIGESGSGKTMTCMSLLNLLPDKAKVVQGSIKFNNIDLLNVSIEDIRKVRGSEIAMIMQNPIWAKLFWDWKSRIRERFGFWGRVFIV